MSNIYIYIYTRVDPQQNCCGVLLDMWVDGSVMHVSSSTASNNLCGTCGLMDLSCMFRHQVRARSEVVAVFCWACGLMDLSCMFRLQVRARSEGSACKVARKSSWTERSACKVARKSTWTEGSACKVARKSSWTE